MSGFFSRQDGEFWDDESEPGTDVIPGMVEEPTRTTTPGYRGRHTRQRSPWLPVAIGGLVAVALAGGGGWLLGGSATPPRGNPVIATVTETETPRAIEVTTTRRGWRTHRVLVSVTATRTVLMTPIPRPAVTVTETPSPKPGPTVTKTIKVEVTVSAPAAVDTGVLPVE